MNEEQIEKTLTLSSMIKKSKERWCKKRKQLYESLISLAGLNDHKLSNSEDDNLEYAMETILHYGTYAENAKALRMYGEYLNLYDFFED